MKIAVFCPKSEFSKENQERLASFGEVVYTESRKEYPPEELKRIASDADIMAIDPDNFGGFEKAMVEAIKSGKVYGYAYEAEDLENTPLASLENAIGIKGFGWYTKEALENMFRIWVDNIEAINGGKPQNVVF